jgi:uncharacterized protein (TIGR03790 family)
MPQVVPRTWRTRALAAALSLPLGAPAYAQSAANVAVVINDNSPDSQRIGEHYARARSLPPENVLRIKAPVEETVERGIYAATIEGPLAAAIQRNRLHDRLLYLVLTKGVPLRVAGTTGSNGTLASVDSELTLLYRKMTGRGVAAAGRVDNPYFLGARAVAEARPFSHRDHDIYLVTRLDAFTADQAVALVDKALSPVQHGRIVLQSRDGDLSGANGWIAQASGRLAESGNSDRIDRDGPALGYYAWGAVDPARRARTTGVTFAAGAIAATLAGSDARTFAPPPADWVPSGSTDATKFFAGASDILAGDLIRDGVSGLAGHVGEPYLQGAVRPQILFPAYLSGRNLAEAFYLATPLLSWTTVIIGDPLLRPFSGTIVPEGDLEAPFDEATGLPAFFARRRIAQAMTSAAGIPEAAVTLTIRAENLLARGDRAGARDAFERALAAAPEAPAILLALAQLEEADSHHDAAIDRYRRLIELQPENVVALNNLAYALAVHQKAPAEALPLAKRAVALAPGSASVLDTLAWIEHLLGNHEGAAKILDAAIKINPRLAEMRMHAAEVAAALGDRPRAESELAEAVRLAPELDQQEATRRLRARIQSLPSKKAG